jgi:GTP-binding protein
MLLAIVGRPNVGKSTLLNRLVGEERVLTGPEAGITRDSIRVEWQWRAADPPDRHRRHAPRSRIEAKLEAASVADTLDAIRWPTSWSSCSTPPTWRRSRTSPSPAG